MKKEGWFRWNLSKSLSCGCSGSITVEMAYVLPVSLLIFAMVMYTVFYYHDKNIMVGAAAETAVLGAQSERKQGAGGETDLGEFYGQRIAGKLILFPEARATTEITEKAVTVYVSAKRGRMSLSVYQRVPIPEPEKKIRRKKLLEEFGRE